MDPFPRFSHIKIAVCTCTSLFSGDFSGAIMSKRLQHRAPSDRALLIPPSFKARGEDMSDPRLPYLLFDLRIFSYVILYSFLSPLT